MADEQQCPWSNKWSKYCQVVLDEYVDRIRPRGIKIDMELVTNHGMINLMEFAADQGMLNLYGVGN